MPAQDLYALLDKVAEVIKLIGHDGVREMDEGRLVFIANVTCEQVKRMVLRMTTLNFLFPVHASMKKICASNPDIDRIFGM